MESLQNTKGEFDLKYLNSTVYGRYLHKSCITNHDYDEYYLLVLLREELPEELELPPVFNGIRVFSKAISLKDFL